MRNYLLFLIFVLIGFNVYAQKYCTISGTITDAANGEQMPGVVVHETRLNKAVAANYYGFYSLSLPKGNSKVCFSHIGYEKDTVQVILHGDTVINLLLKPIVTQINELEVYGKNPSNTQTGVISLKTAQIKNAPVLLGESDLLKTIQLLPGVKGGIEGTGGMYVRGGTPDQNLILLDGVPIYNTSHFFGFFSVFNTDAISGFTFYKGGMLARYSGRLSSVLDIKMKEGNNQKLSGEGSLGLIASKITLEGPLGGKNTSFIVSGRRTFIDILTLPLRKMKSASSDAMPGYYFYDLSAKINHKINDRNRVYLSIYNGKDYAGTSFKGSSGNYESKIKSTNGFGWGNFTTAVRWNWQPGSKLFSNLTLVYSNYTFKIEDKREETETKNGILNTYLNRYTSGINDLGARWDVEYYATPNYTIRTGANITRHMFNPGVNIIRNPGDKTVTSIDTTFGNKNIWVNELFGYVENEFKLFENLTTNLGVHYSVFMVEGKNYQSIQPRLSMAYQATDQISLKTSYGKVSQYLHLLTNSTIGLPTYLWLPATSKVKPQEAWQYSAGVYYQWNKGYSFSLEGYIKEMLNLIEYKEGASFYQINSSWEDKIESGRGTSKGIELFVQKNTGKLTGWVGVTLSKTDRKFENINFGQEFPFRYDSRLDISALATYQISDRIRLNAAWVFHTGNAVTLALEKIPAYNADTSTYASQYVTWVKNVTSRNNFRTPVYHRLDVGVDFIKQKKHHTRTWSIGIYNIYNRLNPFYIYPDIENGKATIQQFSLFPALPYVKYSVKF